MLRAYFTEDLYTGLILFCLVLIVTTSQLFEQRFVDFVSVVWNDKYSKLYSRDRKKLDLFNGLLFLNLVISSGLFLIICYKNIIGAVDNKNVMLLIFVVTLFFMLLLKVALERLVAYFFEFTHMVKQYLFRKATYKNVSGLILLVTNVLLIFSGIDRIPIIYVTIVIIFLINFIGFIRFIKDYQKTIIPNLFYFLLYLCALGMGPYIILYKVIKDYFG